MTAIICQLARLLADSPAKFEGGKFRCHATSGSRAGRTVIPPLWQVLRISSGRLGNCAAIVLDFQANWPA
jgi:hypothetical protein